MLTKHPISMTIRTEIVDEQFDTQHIYRC